MRLYDLDQPCEHGMTDVHGTQEIEKGGGVSLIEWCPGGAEVSIDLKAAAEAGFGADAADAELWTIHVVSAALGFDIEED